MSARHPQGLFFLLFTIFFTCTLLMTVPCILAWESMQAEVTCFAGVVSGVCFHDANGNGIREDEELGISGMPLALKRIGLLRRMTEIGTTLSDAEGIYEFTGLRRGYYLVEAQSTAQWECSAKNPQLVMVARFIKNQERDVAFQKTQEMPSVSISADPSEIERGASATLIWTSENADRAHIDQGIGEVALNGTLTVTPEQTTVYTIRVEGSLGTAQDCVTVVVSTAVTTTTSVPLTTTTTSRPTTTTTIPEITQDSYVLSEFQFNSMDTHMYWDGTYLWLPETEYLTGELRFSTNLIRLNPVDFSYTRYNLPPVDYGGRGVFPIVYEVVSSPSDSDILYVSAPYGQPKALYVFHQSSGEAYGYRLINGELAYGGNNGARMAVTVSGGNDTVWITCNDSRIATFDVASAIMTELHDFSGIAPGGLYGIAAVPAAAGDTYIIHVASFGGKLLIFPSDLTSVSQSITIDVAEYGVSEAVLMALIYDEPYIWIAGHGNYRGTSRLFLMRYMPGAEFDVTGECTFYWSNVSTGMVPSLVSYGNWVFAVVEHMDCSARELIRLNKSTGAVDDFEIQFQNPRVAASLGHDDNGNIYAGGFGCSSELIRPLELVRFTNAAIP